MIIGIDPGLKGGITFLDEGRAWVFPMPVDEDGIDAEHLLALLEAYKKSEAVAYLEKQQAMPGQGVTSMMTIGRNYGIIYGILKAIGIKVIEIRPREWQKAILPHAEKGKSKEASIAYALEHDSDLSTWLATPRSRKPSDGMTDGFCIARYGELQLKNSEHAVPSRKQ